MMCANQFYGIQNVLYSMGTKERAVTSKSMWILMQNCLLHTDHNSFMSKVNKAISHSHNDADERPIFLGERLVSSYPKITAYDNWSAQTPVTIGVIICGNSRSYLNLFIGPKQILLAHYSQHCLQYYTHLSRTKASLALIL